MATEYAKRDDAGLYPTFYAVLDERGQEDQIYSYGEGGCSIEGGCFDLEEWTA